MNNVLCFRTSVAMTEMYVESTDKTFDIFIRRLQNSFMHDFRNYYIGKECTYKNKKYIVRDVDINYGRCSYLLKNCSTRYIDGKEITF